MVFPPDNDPKGNPVVISDTEGEEITPDNPEIVKQYPVEQDKKSQQEVEITPQVTPKVKKTRRATKSTKAPSSKG